MQFPRSGYYQRQNQTERLTFMADEELRSFLTLLQHWSGAVMCPACGLLSGGAYPAAGEKSSNRSLCGQFGAPNMAEFFGTWLFAYR